MERQFDELILHDGTKLSMLNTLEQFTLSLDKIKDYLIESVVAY